MINKDEKNNTPTDYGKEGKKNQINIDPNLQTSLFVEFDGFKQPGSVLEPNRLRNRLIDELPWSHILRERIFVVIYIDEVCRQSDGTFFRGEVELLKSGGAIIKIYQQPSIKEHPELTSVALSYHTVYHEIAHVVYSRLPSKAEAYWVSLCPSDRPEPSIFQKSPVLPPHEEFAECYAHFVQQPKALKMRNLAKYDFVHFRVFAGREYGQYYDDSNSSSTIGNIG